MGVEDRLVIHKLTQNEHIAITVVDKVNTRSAKCRD